MSIQKNKTSEINNLHKKIKESLKSTVRMAVEIGGLLFESKKIVGHNNFLSWIEKNCIFKIKTADRYMHLFKHNRKMVNVTNLREAYDIVQIEENKQKKKKWEDDQKLITKKIKTGENPEGWDDRLQREYKKRINDGEYEKRKKKLFTGKKDNSREKIEEQIRSNREDDGLDDLIEKLKKEDIEKQKLKDKINMDGKQNPFFDVLDDYLNGLDSDSRRIEALHNLIRYSKKLVNEFQRETINT